MGLGMLSNPMVTDWTEYLDDGFIMQVYLNTIFSQIVSFSVVLIKDDECISRYDTAHGYAHRDVLGRKSASPLIKVSYDSWTLEEVFRHARQDYSQNYARYYEHFQTH